MAMEAISKSVAAYQGGVSAPEAAPSAVKATSNVTVNEAVSAPSVVASVAGNEAQIDDANHQVNNETIKKAVDEINKTAKNSEAVFGIHDATNRVTIKIVDKNTKEVIKEFPPEKTLDMIAKVWEMAGLMVDEKR